MSGEDGNELGVESNEDDVVFLKEVINIDNEKRQTVQCPNCKHVFMFAKRSKSGSPNNRCLPTPEIPCYPSTSKRRKMSSRSNSYSESQSMSFFPYRHRPRSYSMDFKKEQEEEPDYFLSNSGNEELDTTNEELDTTNEELDTTNEEFPISNEELDNTIENDASLDEASCSEVTEQLDTSSTTDDGESKLLLSQDKNS